MIEENKAHEGKTIAHGEEKPRRIQLCLSGKGSLLKFKSAPTSNGNDFDGLTSFVVGGDFSYHLIEYEDEGQNNG